MKFLNIEKLVSFFLIWIAVFIYLKDLYEKINLIYICIFFNI